MISVIATVLNEGESIRHLMESLTRQSQPPDEIVIVDGGSQDQTVAIMQSYRDRLPLKILVEAGCNISQGRNRAISAAQGDILAITDAGVRLQDDWLASLTAPLLADETVDVACGFFIADPQSLFEVALGATTLPNAVEIDPASFLPSSRSVAVRKAAALQASLYPEWLDYCEDLIFDLCLKAQGARFVFVPQAAVFFRPRPDMRSYFKQYYRYARGDGKADLWRKRHVIRYITYLLLVPGVLLAGLLLHPLLWGGYLLGGAVYLYAPYRRLPQAMARSPRRDLPAWLSVMALIPLLRVWGDLAKMLGYPVGWRWRKDKQPPGWCRPA